MYYIDQVQKQHEKVKHFKYFFQKIPTRMSFRPKQFPDVYDNEYISKKYDADHPTSTSGRTWCFVLLGLGLIAVVVAVPTAVVLHLKGQINF